MQRFVSNKLFKVFFVIVFFLFLIFLNPYNIINPFRGVVNTISLPFKKMLYSFSAVLSGTGEFLGSIGQLKSENANLLKVNQELLAKNAILNDMQNENTILREQLKLLPRNNYDLMAATVVSQDPSGIGNWLEIDRGSVDGVISGMPVIVSNSILVGRIQDVSFKSSKVMLLTNSKSTINVMTAQNNTRGIAKGEYGLGIIFDMILQTDAISVDDEVITSGMGGEMPRGLFVGSVREVHASDDHLFQQAVIAFPFSASKLQAVFIIKGNK